MNNDRRKKKKKKKWINFEENSTIEFNFTVGRKRIRENLYFRFPRRTTPMLFPCRSLNPSFLTCKYCIYIWDTCSDHFRGARSLTRFARHLSTTFETFQINNFSNEIIHALRTNVYFLRRRESRTVIRSLCFGVQCLVFIIYWRNRWKTAGWLITYARNESLFHRSGLSVK